MRLFPPEELPDADRVTTSSVARATTGWCVNRPKHPKEDPVGKTIALLCALAVACATAAGAADAAETAKQQPVVGTWQGTLPNGMGGQIRVVLKVRQAAEGGLTATMDSPDQNASDIPVAKITFENGKLTLEVAAVGGSYEGTLDPAKNEIAGTWKQSGQALPLAFKKEPAKDGAKEAVEE